MKLFIGNLGDEGLITSEDLRTRFESFGEVSECEVVRNYAFVHMGSDVEALEALTRLNGISIKGRRIKVEKGEEQQQQQQQQQGRSGSGRSGTGSGRRRGNHGHSLTSGSTKLFIGNLSDGTSGPDLEEIFRKHVGVVESDVIKNYGFIHIDPDASKSKVMEVVRELNGYELKGNKIRVQISTSVVRKRPGITGDTCYRCGREGHWSRACPVYPSDSSDVRKSSSSSRDIGYRGSSDRGSSNNHHRPMRSAFSDSNNRTTLMGGPSSNHFLRGGEPYPAPHPPAYIHDRGGSGDYDYSASRNNYPSNVFAGYSDGNRGYATYDSTTNYFNRCGDMTGALPPRITDNRGDMPAPTTLLQCAHPHNSGAVMMRSSVDDAYRESYYPPVVTGSPAAGYGIGSQGYGGGYGSVISTATGQVNDMYSRKPAATVDYTSNQLPRPNAFGATTPGYYHSSSGYG